MALQEHFAEILSTPAASRDDGMSLGTSREGRTIRSFRFGTGPRRISLLAGCHADEPVGPLLLRRLSAYIASQPADHPLLTDWEWWVVPHINPDGERRNRVWYDDADEHYDIGTYLTHVIRERPGDDIEFGFPRDATDAHARPENRAAYEWWRSADGPFALHLSFHGMAFAAGPWFLVDAAWMNRCAELMTYCTAATQAAGYELHDVERLGEKGFVRIGRGFTTRPDSRAMRAHFLGLGDETTAARFRPSSMETVRSLGGDTLTLVSEMPLFLTPGVGQVIGPPDPAAEAWRARIEGWRGQISQGADTDAIRAEADDADLRPMPVRDQMILQLTMLDAGMRQVEKAGTERS